MKEISLTINGEQRTIAVKVTETLQDMLRERLHLTGTKKGCSKGVCGACTVLVDGEPKTSCLILAATCGGTNVTTIEGLAKDGRLHPLQKSFIHHGAIQCGYCTPGMVVSAFALIQRNQDPNDDEIKEALGGNLCRCTGYKRILDAVRNWKQFKDSEGLQSPNEISPIINHKDDLNKFTIVGRSFPRTDAVEKVTGRAIYTGDIFLPNMLYGKILHSPIARGNIKSIDTRRAEALPGVRAVITGKDVPETMYGVSPARYDEHILAKNSVRYVGDEIAAVAAIDEETAEEALSLIKVEYEELPAVLDPIGAMEEGAPLVHKRYKNNVNTIVDHHFGDIVKGFRESKYIREMTFTGNFVQQAPMEPHASIVDWKDDLLTIHSSTQVPHYLHYQIANVFGIPLGKIQVIRPKVGGGFGGKAEATPLDLCAALLSKKTGQPVKMVYTREEMFLHHRGRHKQYIKMKLGLDAKGKIKALDSSIILDGGAYSSFGVISTYYAGSMIPTLYKMPNYRYLGKRVMTNKPACGAMRGHGTPQPRFALECLINVMCEEHGLDPVKVREINGMTPNYHTCNDLDIRSCEYKATIKKAVEASGWYKKRGKLGPGHGIGIASGGFVSGAGYAIYRGQVQLHTEKESEHFQKKAIFPHANAYIKVSEDGTHAVVFIGAAEIGQGSDTVLRQIAAEALGIPLDRVRMRTDDTETSPIDLGAYSSRVTLMGGNAVKRAGEEVQSKLLVTASKIFQCSADELKAHNGIIYSIKDSSKKIEWAETARRYFNENSCLMGQGWYKPPEGLGGDYKGAAVGTSPAYSFGTTIAEVSVDLDTGQVKVERCWDYHDCGTPINPMAVHGQVEGAIVMTSGETIMEDIVFDEKGRIKNPNLHDYLVMTIKDAPDVYSGIVDSYEPEGPYGAKEIGEGATVPVLGAVASAIANAIGVWITDLPITPEKVLNALKKK